jgi:hypothetical protein
MNTAEQTAGAILQMPSLELSLLQRIALVMPWVSPESRAELERVHQDVRALITANRHLALQLADARDELDRLRGEKAAA